MAGLEYRYNKSGVGITPAFDLEADDTYYDAFKPNDPVKRNASGKIVRATSADANILGVAVAREILIKDESPKFVKVRTDKQAVYEVKIAAGGTPVVGTAYGLTDDAELDASNTTNASVRVEKLTTDGNALVSLV